MVKLLNFASGGILYNHIMKNSEGIEQKPQYNLECITKLDEETWKQISELERKTFGWGLTDEDMTKTRGAVEHPGGVTVVARGEQGQVMGYIVGYPSDAAYVEISEEDKNMSDNPATIYIMTLALEKILRDRVATTFREIMGEFIKQASEKGYDSFAAHSPSSHMSAYNKFFGAESRHEIEDWCDSGEPHVYWIAKINKEYREQKK